MSQFNKVAIIGVGLIGGSIGLAIKKNKVAKKVIGVFRHEATRRKALKRKAVDKAVMSIAAGVRNADLVIIASPVLGIPGLAKEALKHAKKGAIITDVGSTKGWIVNEIEKRMSKIKGIHFVGSHPMAGSEHAGVEFARADLLEGAPCIVTKTDKTDAAALRKMLNFWKALGAKVTLMTPARHDLSVSLISHLPHIVAFGLAGAVPARELPYAAEGFKDTTRVASSDAKLWADIFLTNKKEIAKAGRLFAKYFETILRAISENNYSKTVALLQKAKDNRKKLTYGKAA